MKIIATYIIVSMFMTMLILYYTSPPPKIIVKYPTLDQKVSDVYIDEKDVCYRYHRIKVDWYKKIFINAKNNTWYGKSIDLLILTRWRFKFSSFYSKIIGIKLL